MTIADIQEYIKKQVEKYDEIPDEYQDAKFKQAIADLVIVLGMLDELEPKAKWKVYKKRKGEIKIGADIQCSNCGSISDMLTNYCYWCGCKMDDEPMEIIESEGEHNMTIEDYLEENNK